VLCDFCEVDFASYDPTFFGRSRGTRLESPQHLSAISQVQITKDKFCPNCRMRLAFLRFVDRARAGA